jgi:hypothetical protein
MFRRKNPSRFVERVPTLPEHLLGVGVRSSMKDRVLIRTFTKRTLCSSSVLGIDKLLFHEKTLIVTSQMTSKPTFDVQSAFGICPVLPKTIAKTNSDMK